MLLIRLQSEAGGCEGRTLFGRWRRRQRESTVPARCARRFIALTLSIERRVPVSDVSHGAVVIFDSSLAISI